MLQLRPSPSVLRLQIRGRCARPRSEAAVVVAAAILTSRRGGYPTPYSHTLHATLHALQLYPVSRHATPSPLAPYHVSAHRLRAQPRRYGSSARRECCSLEAATGGHAVCAGARLPARRPWNSDAVAGACSRLKPRLEAQPSACSAGAACRGHECARCDARPLASLAHPAPAAGALVAAQAGLRLKREVLKY